ncbi:hypothetical protein MFRU_075g00150 [Monilinia fructicola]|uniref:N-acetyltransferase domain-containing protein n=1 Tax=Monilinia fructicola TaxID=38448 RepID=A0A5M9JWM8_MONFR|nr:hypothetical protein EYC84_000531 [Monilinia fructicola]KAG4024993.1 hypothetical protein MFRU_075g00150 [Monilinia fructicola]
MVRQNTVPEVHERPEVKVLPHHTVREGQYEDLALLKEVERSAQKVFKDVCSEESLMIPEELVHMVEDHKLWVAVNGAKKPVGFICGFTLDGHFHIERLAVARLYQRQGIGGALMARMTTDIKEQGFRAITLTTTMYYPFHGPWYQTLGFFEMDDKDVGHELAQLIDEQTPEDMHNYIPWCPMKKNI